MQIKETLGIGNKALEGREPAGGVKRAGKAASSASGDRAQQAAGDRVELSSRSVEMAKASEALAQTPDVRSAKVAEIKRQIANQEYKVEAEKVAHKMIVDFLGELV